jgi:primosomal protein N' (replication factor Y)
MMICHFCGLEKKGLSLCPNCSSAKLSFKGAGTQKLEEKLKELFPDAPLKRLDTDVITKKWESQDILNKFGGGKYSILIGTQMVAKGHHFPDVAFVAVIGADIGMSLPDFRASERSLQLLIQASGRAGRKSNKRKKGMVMVQSFDPDNPVFSYLIDNNYLGFLEEELRIREGLGYPPFTRLISITLSSVNQDSVQKSAFGLKTKLKEISLNTNMIILGPAKPAIFKRGKLFRYQILIKTPVEFKISDTVKEINRFGSNWRGGSIRLDVDPMSFM